ncbi:MAG: fumarate hydratase, partial [Synechococcaceae bacterium WB9_2_170]|nr:fumarate hydratase [Synechococcaceae bacterium WB9_2_170]
MTLHIDLLEVEEAARTLYIRALKVLPPDIKEGMARLVQHESGATAKSVLHTMV